MIRSITLSNLKCFDALSVELAPLTILSGYNSGGKSTTLQALLLLSQTLNANHRTPTLDLNGGLVSLGSPVDVLGKSGSSLPLVLGLGAEDDTDFTWSFGLSDDRRFLSASELVIQKSAARLQCSAGELCGLLPALDGWAASDALREFRRIVYLSATRGIPTDVYPIPEDSDLEDGNVGSLGQFAAWWLHHEEDAAVPTPRHCPDGQNATLRAQLNAWACRLFTQAEFNSVPIPKTNLIRLELKTGLTSDWSRPVNNGFGISYAFPILLAGLISPAGRTIVIDSPEAHLHPKGQSRMGSFLAQMAASGVQLLVETHSDHLLNGVRIALKNGAIRPEDVALYFFSGEGETPVIRLTASANGDISDWPEGFFDQSERDLASLAGWM